MNIADIKRLGNNPNRGASSLAILLAVVISVTFVILVGAMVYTNMADRIRHGDIQIEVYGECQDAGHEFGSKQFEDCLEQKMKNKK